MRYLILLVLSLAGRNAFCQTVISGRLKDESDKPIENVNLILYEKKSDNVVAYSVSDQKGSFSLSFTDNSDSLRLEISLIGFDKLVKTIINKKAENLNFSLHPTITVLPDVVIKQEPIQISGDTINYNVKSFSDKSDRVIIDVLKKIPGIKVTENGQILFNNKAINKFYIEGKDLLENRYSIASNNLPSDAVDQIQVLQNHQPITLLNGIEQSDRAAINIKLNKNSKLRLLGNGQAGVGFKPLLADNNLTVLKFAKDIQYINSLKYNNIGLNLDKEITDQNLSNNLYASGSFKQDIVSLVKASAPPVDQARYWFNDNTLATGNYLIGLNKTFDLKFNAAFEHDRIRDNASSLTKIYLTDDTVTIDEGHIGLTEYSKLLTGLTLQANTKKTFLKNDLQFQRIWGNATDNLNPNNINQSINNPFINLINDLGGMIKVNNSVIGVNSYTAFNDLPQSLRVNPGQFPDILNNGMGYQGLLQENQLKSFFTDNSVSISKRMEKFSFNNKTGILFQLQNLNNDLAIQQNDLFSPLSGIYRNVIERNRLKLYNDANLSFTYNSFMFSTGLKASFNTLGNTDIIKKMDISRFFLNPNFNVVYKFNTFWETSVNASFSNNISYDGNPTFILQSYRSLVSNDIPQRESHSKNISYRLGYKNIINAVYSNLDISYLKGKSNVLISTKFDGILSTRIALLQDNPSSSIDVNWNISKYYILLKTSFGLSLRYNENKSQQLQQGVLTDFFSDTYIFGTKINSAISKGIVIEHSLDLTIDKTSSRSILKSERYASIDFLKQMLVFKYFLPKAFQTHLNVEHYYNTNGLSKGMNYYFADFTVKKSLSKPKLDLSILLSNIFDTKSYSSYFNDTNLIVSSKYMLRGRMLMFKAGFQF